MKSVPQPLTINDRKDLAKAIANRSDRLVFSPDFMPWPQNIAFYSCSGADERGINPFTRVYHPGQWALPDEYENLVRLILNGTQAVFRVDSSKQSAVRFVEVFLAALNTVQSAVPLFNDNTARYLYTTSAVLNLVSTDVAALATPCAIGTTAGKNIRGYEAKNPSVIWTKSWQVEQDIEVLLKPLIKGLLPRPVKSSRSSKWNKSLQKWVQETVVALHKAFLLHRFDQDGELNLKVPDFPVSKPGEVLVELVYKMLLEAVKSQLSSNAWAEHFLRPHVAMFDLAGDSFQGGDGVQTDYWGHPIGFILPFAKGSVGVFDHQAPEDIISLYSGGTNQRPPLYAHTDDFRSVRFNGIFYSFTPNQAIIIQALWEFSEKGIYSVSVTELLDKIDSATINIDKKIRQIFKLHGNKMHPAWLVVIVKDLERKGFYKLSSVPA